MCSVRSASIHQPSMASLPLLAVLEPRGEAAGLHAQAVISFGTLWCHHQGTARNNSALWSSCRTLTVSWEGQPLSLGVTMATSLDFDTWQVMINYPWCKKSFFEINSSVPWFCHRVGLKVNTFLKIFFKTGVSIFPNTQFSFMPSFGFSLVWRKGKRDAFNRWLQKWICCYWRLWFLWIHILNRQ